MASWVQYPPSPPDVMACGCVAMERWVECAELPLSSWDHVQSWRCYCSFDAPAVVAVADRMKPHCCIPLAVGGREPAFHHSWGWNQMVSG